jgi:hypothetical protein
MQAGVLEHVARRLDEDAGAELRREGALATALAEPQASVARLRAAVLAQGAAATRQAIGQLKGPFSRLFLRFG